MHGNKPTLAGAAQIPERQLALRLVSKPHPSHLHRCHPRPRVAGLVDSLVVFALSAVVRRQCEAA